MPQTLETQQSGEHEQSGGITPFDKRSGMATGELGQAMKELIGQLESSVKELDPEVIGDLAHLLGDETSKANPIISFAKPPTDSKEASKPEVTSSETVTPPDQETPNGRDPVKELSNIGNWAVKGGASMVDSILGGSTANVSPEQMDQGAKDLKSSKESSVRELAAAMENFGSVSNIQKVDLNENKGIDTKSVLDDEKKHLSVLGEKLNALKGLKPDSPEFLDELKNMQLAQGDRVDFGRIEILSKALSDKNLMETAKNLDTSSMTSSKDVAYSSDAKSVLGGTTKPYSKTLAEIVMDLSRGGDMNQTEVSNGQGLG